MPHKEIKQSCHGKNPFVAELSSIPFIEIGDLHETLSNLDPEFERVISMFAVQNTESSSRLYCIIANDLKGVLYAMYCTVGREYESLSVDCPQVHLFEREIFEQYGIRPKGHPWLKPVRFENNPVGGIQASGATCGDMEYFSVEGNEIHEVAVGPIHAGVIEPGHFRFQCHGEHVFHLEISLGYQHRGIERTLCGGPHKQTMTHMEAIAGDTSVGHSLTHCQLIEAMTGLQVPPRGEALRAIALELERLANHTGDLGALANDVGYLPTASFCGRIRGDFLNMTALLCGSRMGRGWIVPGGVRFDIEGCKRFEEFKKSLKQSAKDVNVAVELLWDSPSVMARFERTGAVSLRTCNDLGLVGPAARACGADRDIRRDFPCGYYKAFNIPISVREDGCVLDRAQVRWEEIQASLALIQSALKKLPDGEIRTLGSEAKLPQLPPNTLAVSLTEGWRGEICHTAITDAQGKFARYKIVDPSFHNWFGLAMALRNEQISDFPLCNKSFNLSYCGFDL